MCGVPASAESREKEHQHGLPDLKFRRKSRLTFFPLHLMMVPMNNTEGRLRVSREWPVALEEVTSGSRPCERILRPVCSQAN